MKNKALLFGCGEWGFRELEIELHFQIAARFGFHYLEIGIGGGQIGRLPEKMNIREVADFIALRKAHDIQTPFFCVENDFTLADKTAQREMLNRTKSNIRLAAALGGTHVRLFAGFTPALEMTKALWTQLFTSLSACAELASSLGLQIAIETHGRITMTGDSAFHEHTVTTEPKALRKLVKGLPHNVGINYDPGNLKAANPLDKTYSLSILNKHINYCHLKDWKKKGQGWVAVAPGDDGLDYGQLLRELSFDGVLLIEYEPTQDVEDGIARSLDYLSKLGIPWGFT